MSFLLDTNICSAHMRRPGGLAHRFMQYSGGLAIPSIVLAELYAGAYHHPTPEPLVRKIELLLQDVTVLPFEEHCAQRFGQIRGELLRRGLSVSSTDTMIAAVALTHDLTFVTHNVRDFQAIPDLRIEDWLQP